jgi:predicted GNAT superfamily acetyltransferase
MKEFQREYARSIGVPVIAWSFDPLQAGNAHFNLRRLGATASRYIEDMYGLRTDDLNRGVPTDRLIAEWPVDPADSAVEDDFQAMTFLRLVEGPGEPVVVSFDSLAGMSPLLVEIPAEIARLRLDDPHLAERWRAAIAEALSSAFAAGYVAEDVVREAGRSFYVLRRP